MSEKSSNSMPADLLIGASAIAEFLFGDPALRWRVYKLADPARGSGRLPAFTMGSQRLYARRSTLERWISEREGKAA